MTAKLPRSVELRTRDPLGVTYTRIMEWSRDVVRVLRGVREVKVVTVDVPASPNVTVDVGFRVASVTVARVVSGTVTATPGIAWSPEGDGFTITALYGVTGDARLSLRAES